MAKTGPKTKCTPELINNAQKYMDGGFEEHGHVIPSIAGLSLVLGVTRKTLHGWAHHPERKEISYILEAIKTKQEQILISKGLKGEFNSNIVKLVLGKHGYHDKQDVEQSGPGGDPQKYQWTIEIIEARANSIESIG